MNPVVHFEMPYEDADRMARFYQSAFKWKTKKLGEKMDIPGIGAYVSFMDSEGNRVSMLEPLANAGSGRFCFSFTP